MQVLRKELATLREEEGVRAQKARERQHLEVMFLFDCFRLLSSTLRPQRSELRSLNRKRPQSMVWLPGWIACVMAGAVRQMREEMYTSERQKIRDELLEEARAPLPPLPRSPSRSRQHACQPSMSEAQVSGLGGEVWCCSFAKPTRETDAWSGGHVSRRSSACRWSA